MYSVYIRDKITYILLMNMEQIENEVSFVEDFEVRDLKVLMAYLIQKLEIIEEDIQDIKESLDI